MWRDDAYLLDILLHAKRIQKHAKGLTREKFEANEILQSALEHWLLIIGEAARSLSDATKETHPDIPWREIISFRNRIIHEYFRVDLRIVWNIIQEHIPSLIEKVQPLIPPESQ